MASACPRCGATKTESVWHGIFYKLAWSLGYHLRRCSSCNRPRLFKRIDRDRPHPNDRSYEDLEADFNRKIAEAGGDMPKEPKPAKPAKADEVSETYDDYETFDDGDLVTDAPLADEVREAREANGDASCPRCTSTLYRRSRRNFLERLLKRPRMARCLRCNHRFPLSA